MNRRTFQANDIDGAQASAKVARKLPSHQHFHVVRRDLRWLLPSDWEWSGPVAVGALVREASSFVVSGALWPQEIQDRMDGAVVVSSVLGTLAPETIFNWVGQYRDDPGRDWLHPRKPRLLVFPRGHALRITMAQCRQGDLLVRPVRRIA